MSETNNKIKDEFAAEVANHYNHVEQKPFSERAKSVIIELRRFNNAMKSLMHLQAFKFAQSIVALESTNTRRQFRVLDLGCGKGGDLPKYLRNEQVGLVVGADIADVSIEQCKERYNLMRRMNGRKFKGEFFVADLTREDIGQKLRERNCLEKFHIASTQFSIHYSFESYEQAVKYISNAANNLIRHGLLIGTYPDGPKLLKLARKSPTPGLYEVDDILSVKFEQKDLDNPKPFGTKYHFKLKEVVDCPEFLVHPTVLEKLLKELGFHKVFDRSFEEHLSELLGSVGDKERVKDIIASHDALSIDLDNQKATLDESMWKAASIYRCFIYRTN